MNGEQEVILKRKEFDRLNTGNHEILLRIPFGEKTDLEWPYLLEAFGVQLAGAQSVLTPMTENPYFGDYTGQSFPFYAGNMEYICRTYTQMGYYNIRIAHRKYDLTNQVDWLAARIGV